MVRVGAVRVKLPRSNVPPFTVTDVARIFEPRLTAPPAVVTETVPKFCVPVLSVQVFGPKIPLMFSVPVVLRNVPPLFTLTLPALTVSVFPLRLTVPVEAVDVPTVNPQVE